MYIISDVGQGEQIQSFRSYRITLCSLARTANGKLWAGKWRSIWYKFLSSHLNKTALTTRVIIDLDHRRELVSVVVLRRPISNYERPEWAWLLRM